MLVTGGAGYVGSHICFSLLQKVSLLYFSLSLFSSFSLCNKVLIFLFLYFSHFSFLFVHFSLFRDLKLLFSTISVIVALRFFLFLFSFSFFFFFFFFFSVFYIFFLRFDQFLFS